MNIGKESNHSANTVIIVNHSFVSSKPLAELLVKLMAEELISAASTVDADKEVLESA